MGDHRPTRLTQADIARHAGVSQTTVSLVLNGRASQVRISPTTQELVLEAVRSLGYTIDPVARGLAGAGTRLLGVFTFESVFPREPNDFYHPFLAGIEEEAERLGYDLVLFTGRTSGPVVPRSIFRNGVNRLRVADGAVLLGLPTDRTELARLTGEGYPYVHIGRRESDGDDVPFVAADYTTATVRVVEHLAALGHRTIGYLAPVVDDEPTADREQGFHHAAVAGGLSPDLVVRHAGEGPTANEVVSLLDRGATALVVHHASQAAAVGELLALRGMTVPADCSLVALDEPAGHQVAGRALTGFSIPRHDMGASAVQLLVRRIESPGPTAPRTLLPCELLVGQTCGPPA